jgi:hypothetical protein
MKGYTSKTAVENYLLITIDDTFDTQITAWIESIEMFIDRYTDRNFVADGTASEQLYDGNGKTSMLIDDCVEVTTVTIDDTEVDEDDYLLYPANTERKNKIQLTTTYFSRDHQNITIEAKWGYSVECPADITLAATIFVAGIINFSNDAKGKVRSETIGRYSVSYDTDRGWQDFNRAKDILNSYKKFSF